MTKVLTQSVMQVLFEALPGLPAERIVDLLEFIAVQHYGGNFNQDNTMKGLEIASFCKRRPFAVSKSGVAALARLARHALGSSEGTGSSAEHHLWLITSGALNTAAAICEHDGDTVALFEAVRSEGSMRGRYVHRYFANAAMQCHLRNPQAFREDLPPPEVWPALRRQLTVLNPCAHVSIAILIFVCLVAGTVVISESAANRMIDSATGH